MGPKIKISPQNYFDGKFPHRVHFGIDSDPEISVRLNSSNNNLHGPLPLPPQNAYMFDLSNNKFSGEITVEAGLRSSGATYVSLAWNKLVGSIPSTFCRKDNYSKPSLSDLDLSNKQLSGPIPLSMGNCGLLESPNLGWNNISGNVPNELQHATRLTILLLNDNSLNGSFHNLKKLQNLEFLRLGNNNFEGSIPSFIGSFNSLGVISLRSNKFRGSIPSVITNLHNLQLIYLSINNLYGPIPKQIGNWKILWSRINDPPSYVSADPEHIFDVAHQLQMVIEGTIIQFKHLHSYSSGIDLSCNILEGNIPEGIVLFKGFPGRIPRNVGYMTGLDSLDLSFNKLSGEIPKSFTSIDSFGYFNLSKNDLSGKIPRGPHFDTLSLDGSAFAGNSLLCGFPTQHFCESAQNDAKHSEEDDQEDASAVEDASFCFILLLRKQKWWFGYSRLVDSVARYSQRN